MRISAPGVYDIHVFIMATTDGPVGLSDSDVADMAARTDAWFARTTSGKYRFRLVGLVKTLPLYPGRVCDFTPAEDAVAPYLPLTPTEGAADAIWVVVTPEIPWSCPAIGQGYLGAAGVWMMGMRDPDHRSALLNHEIGHNLGLGHSKAVVPHGDSSSWPSGATPELAEYGDALDFMGRDYLVCTWQCTTVRPDIHAHNLNLLGVLPESAIGYVAPGDDTELVLAPVEAAEGLRAVYLPWLNRSKFVLDYRSLDHHGGSAAGPDGPGAGVVVRLVDSDQDFGPSPYDAGGGTAALSEPVLPASGVIRIGMAVDGRRSLPDGTTVTVLSIDAHSATVRISRPVDATPPTVRPSWERDCASVNCRLDPNRVLWETGWAAYDLSVQAGDDQWVKALTMSVRGAITHDDTVESQLPGRSLNAIEGLRAAVTLPPGKYQVRLTATDLGGLAETTEWSLALPTPRPATTWYPSGFGLSWNWMDFERLRCWQSGEFCAGIAVRADRACTRSVIARISSVTEDNTIVQTQMVRLGPLARGKATAMVATFSKDLERVNSFALTSLACSRR